MKTRRYFAGNALPQALMAAARYHGLPPEELAYRLYDKRHGFVNRTRRFIVEVDPAAPRRLAGSAGSKPAPAPPAASAPAPASTPALAPVAPALALDARPSPAPRAEERTAAPRPPDRPEAPESRRCGRSPPAATPAAAGGGHFEPYLPPDAESELAAAVAVGHLLTFAGLDLTVAVERQSERLFLRLGGKDEGLLAELGEPFLDDLEQLAPRAIRGLAGRMVRCTIDGGGLRSAREDELKALAERTAEQVATSGEAALLEPLAAADRRIVHLTLAEDSRVTTESEGFGAEKRLRVSPARSARPTPRPDSGS